MKQVTMQLDVETSPRVAVDEQTRKQLVSLMATAIGVVVQGSLRLEAEVPREGRDDDNAS